MKTLKCKASKVFPGDFDWECPTCGTWNRAFELTSINGKRTGHYTLEDIQASCPNCAWNKRQSEHPHVVIDCRPV